MLLLYDIVNITLRFSHGFSTKCVLVTIRSVLVPIGFDCETAPIQFVL